MKSYRKNLLEQLRMVPVSFDNKDLTDKNMVKAMTVNAELQQLGYCLKATDIVLLARSASLNSFLFDFRPLLDEITAKPMYPDFPSQVMAISEAEFRFHQICHYFSTYGVEQLAEIFGVSHNVTKGWLPEVEDTPKTEKDDLLLKAKVLQLIDEKEMYSLPFEKLTHKNERLTRQEIEIIQEAVSHLDLSECDFDIPFKQNMMPIFLALFANNKEKELRRLCDHTGDVLKCLDYVLTHCNYHFRTSQKKMIIRLIESYPIADWKANVILSNKKARRTVKVLEYLSYNNYAKSPEHKEVVRQLRNGELTSWEGQAKALLADNDSGVLDFIAQRPGMLLRWTNWLLSLGHSQEEILKRLEEKAESLSTRTLAFTATLLGKTDKTAACDIITKVLARKLVVLETPLKGKKVYVDGGRLDLAHSMLLSKGDEAGYIRNGLAYTIPEEVKIIRFFIYWNDKTRVDLDLHANGSKLDGSQVNAGWNANFRKDGLVFSGDITNSDAAEYFDLDLNSELQEVQFNINLFYGKPSFDQIEQCFTGLMAVKKANAKVKLYDPANCFFVNDIRTRTRTLNYGYVNVPGRYLCLDGTPAPAQWMDGVYTVKEHVVSSLTLDKYIDLLLQGQGAEKVTREEAEVILVMEKPEDETQISLIDHNFFF